MLQKKETNRTYLVKLNYIRVPNLLENIDFPCDSFDITLALNSVLLENFDGNLLASNSVSADTHFAESALAQGTA